MERMTMAVLAVLLLPVAVLADGPPATLLNARSMMTLPAYVDAPDLRGSVDEASYEAARADKRFVLEALRYRSGGLEVIAYLYHLGGQAAPAPTVVYNRGGYVVPGHPQTLLVRFHRLAEAGFTVIAPFLRGSAGTEGHDEMGGADREDVAAAIQLGRELELIDPDRIFMYGESRGGMMTYFAIRDGLPIRAAAVFGATSDLSKLCEEHAEQYGPIMKMVWPDIDTRRFEIMERRSAMDWVDSLVRTPLLIMHGADDRSVAVHHALDLASALFERGADVELWIPAKEGHLIAGRSAERDRMAIEWFQKHDVAAH
jgi:dipeptidyl aminopeptidase/acylaminoacyl peptidase